MLHDAGVLTIYDLTPAKAPEDRRLQEIISYWYGERTIGLTRHYAAMGADCKVDMLVEIDEDRSVKTNQYCIPEDGEQYRIIQVQHELNEDGLKISVLTLERIGNNYELAEI